MGHYNKMRSLHWKEEIVINECKKDLKTIDKIKNTDYWELLKFPIYYFCIIEKMIMDNINAKYLNHFNSPVFQSLLLFNHIWKVFINMFSQEGGCVFYSIVFFKFLFQQI